MEHAKFDATEAMQQANDNLLAKLPRQQRRELQREAKTKGFVWLHRKLCQIKMTGGMK